MPQLHKHLGEYESIDELNHLACLLSELDKEELAVFEAVMDSGEYTGSVKDLINLSQNLDSYSFYSDVHTEEDLGRLYIQDFGTVQVPEDLIDYIDYEAYGRDARINEGGHFAPGGYVQGDIPLRSTTTDWRTFPTNTGYSPCLKRPSGSKWPPIRKWRNRLTRPPSAPHPRRAGRSGSPLDTVSRGGR